MRVPFLDTLRSGPPAPRVVLIPDSCFFVRSISLDETTTPEQIPAQVELALEAFSPFPVPQLYHGYACSAGSRMGLLFAAYRRRFTQDQLLAWSGAAWVAPSFCTLLGQSFQEPTTVAYQKDDALTAVHWAAGPVPTHVLVRPLALDLEPEKLEIEKSALLKELPNPGKVLWLSEAPQIVGSDDEKLFAFRAGAESLALPQSLARAMDVRPNEDLEQLRKAQQRELILWRTTLGFSAGIILLALGELALGGFWAFQRTRVAKVQVERPVVEEIMKQQSLSMRIEELATKRLLPFEMITLLADKKPDSIQFLRTTTTGMLTMQVVGQTRNAQDLVAWLEMLGKNPSVGSAEILQKTLRDNMTSFTVLVTFKAEALKPGLST